MSANDIHSTRLSDTKVSEIQTHSAGQTPPTTELYDEIRDYICEILYGFDTAASSEQASVEQPETVAKNVFSILTSRKFCYMGRARTVPYEKETVRLITRRVKNKEPLRIYYYIGGGYHASVHPGIMDLTFGVGLSELFILSQAMAFHRRVKTVYPLGVEFYLVIDNVCALMANDIPLKKTATYCESIKTLIDELGIGNTVKIMIESEQFPLSAYEMDLSELNKRARTIKPSDSDVENVCRFIGRSCGKAEVAERMARYEQFLSLTLSLFAGIIEDVQMTQREKPNSLGFRPFPGGDSSTQCGEVALTRNAKGKLKPILLTSRNTRGFALKRLRYPDLIPAVIPHVTYAEHVRCK
jgi:hypothetical protein